MDEIKNSINMFNEYVGNLPKASTYISDMIKQDDLPTALNLILIFSEGMSWVIEMNTLLVKENVVKPLNIDQLKTFLAEITEGLLVQDYILIADLLEYEIVPFFEEYIKEGEVN